MSRYEELDLSKVRAYCAADRVSKVMTDQLARPPHAGMSMREFLDGLPNILKAEELKAVAWAIVKARELGRPVLAMLGGHVVKTGCVPVITSLAREGFITHFASNGAAAVHDTELARFGHTSEDVGEHLSKGTFGMAGDTAALVAGAAQSAVERGEGYGEALGRMLVEESPSYLDRSLLAAAFQMSVPYTLHVALGTDIVHQHPCSSGAAIGEASMHDFRIMAATVSRLGHGGVVLNFGSAVVMPEVFLKCLAVARNLGHDTRDFTTANFDMIQHYRSNMNVVTRPVMDGGKGYSITGHHEIMIPLLAAAVFEEAVS